MSARPYSRKDKGPGFYVWVKHRGTIRAVKVAPDKWNDMFSSKLLRRRLAVARRRLKAVLPPGATVSDVAWATGKPTTVHYRTKGAPARKKGPTRRRKTSRRYYRRRRKKTSRRKTSRRRR